MAPSKDESWSVRSTDGSVLCELPCNGQVPPRSGYYLQKKENSQSGARRIDLPDVLAPDAVRITPHAGKGAPVLAGAAGVFSLIGAAVGVLFLTAGDTRYCQVSEGSLTPSAIGSISGTGSAPAKIDGPCSSVVSPPGVTHKIKIDKGRSATANRALGASMIGLGLVGFGLSFAWWHRSESPRLEITPMLLSGN